MDENQIFEDFKCFNYEDDTVMTTTTTTTTTTTPVTVRVPPQEIDFSNSTQTFIHILFKVEIV